jgi:autotransporter translocation and assembly factor TamB
MRLKAAGDLNVDVSAACDLKQGDFDLHLLFDDTETAPYFKAAGMPDLHGKLTGRVDATGNIGDIAKASAHVDLDSLHLLSKKNSLIKANRITMQLADQKLSIPEFEMAILTTGSLRLKGDVDFDKHLNIAIDGRIPLAAAGAFSQELADAAGMVALDGNISGDMNAPLIDARIELTDVAMAVPGLVQKLHDLNGRIFLTADTIRIEAMKGFLDTGSFSLAGSVDYDNFKPTRMNLSVNTRALPLEVPDTLTVLINSDITLSGSDRSATARGDIVVLEGLYYKDVKINLLELATGRQRAVPPAHRPLSIPYYDMVGLDIAIRHRQAFAVENNLAQLNITPDLKVGGTLANPILSGRAQVRDGSVTFQKKTFDVQKGVIDFVNPYKTEAEIDIVSKAVIRSWTISLAIKGTPDNLNLQLSSVPSETDSDILSIVLFGRTAKELTDGEGGGAKRTTGQIMAELIADTFGDDIKKQTGVDILQVEENGGNGDQDVGGVKVTVGKHLSDRMTVKYAVETKDGEIIQRAITEYKLLENILVSGFQDNKGIYGSELVFRIEFR